MIFLKNILGIYPGTGALLDDRPEEEQEGDYKFEEIVTSAEPVLWKVKPQGDWRKFPIFSQNGSGSCVAQTLAKILGILHWLRKGEFVHFSATHIYQRRKNKPSLGMSGVDALNILTQGTTLEVLAPSENLTDLKMDTYEIEGYKKEVGEVFKIGNYIELPVKDMETVASVIQKTKKPVMVWFYFKYKEWTDFPSVLDSNLPESGQGIVRHSVTAVDFTLHNEKPALIVEDSWGPSYGLKGQRVIYEDFYKARNIYAAYPINFKFEEGGTVIKPFYKFSKILEFGMKDNDVKSLQDILKFEGLFPNNVESTGFYGSVTAKGILTWQLKYKIALEYELKSLKGKIVGPKTIKKLNEIYGR